MDFEVVKTEAQEFDRWVTGLVDLIPTQVYVSFLKNIYGFHFCLDIQRYVTNKNWRWEKSIKKWKTKKAPWSGTMSYNFQGTNKEGYLFPRAVVVERPNDPREDVPHLTMTVLSKFKYSI